MAGLVGAMATDFKVKERIKTRESVDQGDVDGYMFTLEDGDKVTWRVDLVSGEVLDIHLMNEEQYQKIREGATSFMYFDTYSGEDTSYFERTLEAEGSRLVGDLVLAVFTQGTENATSTYDIEIKVTREPDPLGLLDQICAFGTATCVAIVVVIVIIVAIIFVIARKTRKDPKDVGDTGGGIKYSDSMMRPGFDIPTGPVVEEPGPKRKRKRKKKISKKISKKKGKKKRKKKALAPRAVEVVEETRVECPECGEEVGGDLGHCPSCGTEFDLEQVLECPLCGHTNPADAAKCGGCGAEFE